MFKLKICLSQLKNSKFDLLIIEQINLVSNVLTIDNVETFFSTVCNIGHGISCGSSTCVSCPIGTYSSTPTQACTPCGPGRTTIGQGSDSASDCGKLLNTLKLGPLSYAESVCPTDIKSLQCDIGHSYYFHLFDRRNNLCVIIIRSNILIC